MVSTQTRRPSEYTEEVIVDSYYKSVGLVPEQLTRTLKKKTQQREYSFGQPSTLELQQVQVVERRRIARTSPQRTVKSKEKTVRELGQPITVVIPSGSVAQYIQPGGGSQTRCIVAGVAALGEIKQLTVLVDGSFGFRGYKLYSA